MPDTLVTFTQAMALLPDNTSRLIGPDDVRSSEISLMADRGTALALGGPWTIPITTVNQWVDIPIAIGGAMVQGSCLFWRMDANGHLKYNYAADWPAIVVPAGLARNVLAQAILDIDGQGKSWEFGFTVAGVIQQPVFKLHATNATSALVITPWTGNSLIVADAPVVSISVRNTQDTTDLTVNAMALRTTGGPLP
jgi:hypothetical protein